MNERQAVSLYGTHNPYASALALQNSCYAGPIEGALVRLLDWRETSARMRFAHDAFRRFAGDDRYSCVGAKAALNRDAYRLGVYRALATPASTAGLARDLCAFIAERPSMDQQFATFVAVFEGLADTGEDVFERALWEQLQALHDLDAPKSPWDPNADSDPESPTFAFSFGGEAFFVVGMHPGSSRLARRFPYPALVFNSHAQFRALREKNQYDGFTRIVRARDTALQGSVNPNLSAFGEASEARQYSGRAVEPAWRCPFRP